MQSLTLETAVTEYIHEAAGALQEEVAAGAEVPFELATQPAGRGQASLYCYRPLTAAFIRERAIRLRGLPAYNHAARQLEAHDGLDRYLLSRTGRVERRDRGHTAVRLLLEDVFAEQTDFQLHPERLREALERLDGSGLERAGEVVLVATLHGVALSSPELALTRDLLIARPDALRDVPDGALTPLEGGDLGHLLIVFRAADDDAAHAIAWGCEALRELLCALRLFGDGRITLGGLAWARVGAGSWNAVALGAGGRPHGMLVVTAEQEDELRAFCNLVSRRVPQGDELAWALGRFELGCERASEHEALSDYLLALRAVLEPEGPASGLLAWRLAALCATPDRRAELAERVRRAIDLERRVIVGAQALEHAGGRALVRELGDHLRALLRDVVCGHLDRDLVGLADRLLRADAELEDVVGPPQIRAGELRSREQARRDPGQTGEILHVPV